MDIMNVIDPLSGPVIGAAIGYFTNFIAVKMLFLPRKAVKVFGRTLPFTPGIIPRRKDALAKAMGTMVEKELFTKDALTEMLLADKTVNTVALELTNALTSPERTLGAVLDGVPDKDAVREALERMIADKLCEAVGEMDLATPIAAEGKALIKEKFGALGGMLASDELMAGIAASAEERIAAYLKDNRDSVRAALHTKTDQLLDASLEELTDSLELYPEKLFPIMQRMYSSLVSAYAPVLLSHVSISGAVEKRIQAMDERTLENMILSVMKKELGAIINLGALVGFILGLLNLLF